MTWKTGFNGGSDQTFTLEMRTEGEANFTELATGIETHSSNECLNELNMLIRSQLTATWFDRFDFRTE